MPKNNNAEIDPSLLDSLISSDMDYAIAKCKYVSFSKYCYWILCESSNSDIFNVKDLSRRFKISYPTSYSFFNELTILGFMEKKVLNRSSVFFKLINNSEKPKLFHLLPYIKKTLNEEISNRNKEVKQ